MRTVNKAMLIIAALLTIGCASKKPAKPSARIPLRIGTQIQFRNLQGPDCKVADVFLDAQTNTYVLVCK